MASVLPMAGLVSAETQSVRANLCHTLDGEPTTVTLVPVGKVADRHVDSAPCRPSEIAELP